MITPEQSARSLVPHLFDDGTGEIWDVSSPN
jgi:hypothetical protein